MKGSDVSTKVFLITPRILFGFRTFIGDSPRRSPILTALMLTLYLKTCLRLRMIWCVCESSNQVSGQSDDGADS